MPHELSAADAPEAASALESSDSPSPDALTADQGDLESALLTDIEEPEDTRRFADLDLQPEILQALEDMGYERPMPVQLAVYGPMTAGRDIMVQSRTGSGKTAGFGIPIAQRIEPETPGAQVLALAPTRELALQVSREIAQIVVHKGLLVQPVYGGAPIKPQMDALAAGAQIVVGTPGRVLDHLRRGTLNPTNIRILVLDECDEMLSMGFQEEIEKIIERLPPKGERQTVLFSATIPEEIQRIARRHMDDPEEISLSTGSVAVDEISHFYYVVSGVARTRDLLKVLRAESPDSAIIFCNTREETNTVAKFMQRQGYDAEAISSDLTQRDRERVMKRMRDRNLSFLVATDVAARGIDISDLTHVINYTFPESPEVYVHRTGRTGRAGKSGVAISLVGPRELGSFYYLKLIYKIRPEERELPSAEEMGVLRDGERYERVAELVAEDPGAEYRDLARRVWQSSHGERIVAALIQRLLSQHAAGEDGASPRARVTERREETRREGREERRRDREARREDREDRRRDREARREDREARPVRREDREERRRERDARREGREDREDRRRDREARREEREERPARREDREARREEPEERPARRDREARREEPEERPARREDREARREERRRDREARREERRRRRGADEERAITAEPADEELSPEIEAAVAKEATWPAYDEMDDEAKEFWETWADEKAERHQRQPREASRRESPVDDEDEDAIPSGKRDRSGGSARLYINIGKREGLTAADVRRLLGEGVSEEAAGRIGSVALRNTHCYVRVPEDIVDDVIAAAAGKSYEDRELVIERARR